MSGAELQVTLRRVWQRTRRRVGVAGVLGAALLALAAGLALSGPRLQQAADETASALARRVQALRLSPVSPVVVTAPADIDERIADAVPSFEHNAEDVRKVFDGAERAHVTLLRGDYTVKADAGSPFVTYTATFPVHETYAALKTFTTEVLRELPHAALDEMRMTRPDAGGQVLDATVRFTLVYRRR